MKDRVILHCDLNCFFASVELLSYPALRDVPVAVCGDPESRQAAGRQNGGDHLAGQTEGTSSYHPAAPPQPV